MGKSVSALIGILISQKDVAVTEMVGRNKLQV